MFKKLFGRNKKPEPVVDVSVPVTKETIAQSMAAPLFSNLTFSDELMSALDSYTYTPDAETAPAIEPVASILSLQPAHINIHGSDDDVLNPLANKQSAQHSKTQPESRTYRSMHEFNASNNIMSQACQEVATLRRERSSDSLSSSRAATSTKSATALGTPRVPSQNQAPINTRTKSQSTVMSATKSLPIEKKDKKIAHTSSRRPGKVVEALKADSDDEPLVKYKPVQDKRSSHVLRSIPTPHTSETSTPKLPSTPLVKPVLPTEHMNLSPEQQHQMMMMYYTQMALMQQQTYQQNTAAKGDRKRRIAEEKIKVNGVAQVAAVTGLESEVTLVDADSVEC